LITTVWEEEQQAMVEQAIADGSSRNPTARARRNPQRPGNTA